jgi:hypothetical protein
MMLDASAIDRVVAAGLEAGDFYRETHGRIYRAATSLHQLGQPVDAITVAERLEELGWLEHIGGRPRLHEIASLVAATSNAAHYATIVVSESRRRDLSNLGTDTVRAAQESRDPDAILAEITEKLEHVATRKTSRRPTVTTVAQFIADTEETPEAAVGQPGETLLPFGGLLIMGGEGGASKTTLTLDAAAHLASGTTWLGFPVPRPLRILIIENEGPRPQFRDKLRAKTASWTGNPWADNVHVLTDPWASFSFARPADRRFLTDLAADLHLDLVIADPLDSLGIEGAGTPEDVRGFIAHLKACGMHNPEKPLAFWLLHHFNKAGGVSVVQKLSGAWGGHPDAILGVELGDGQTTILKWGKLRHATPPKSKTTVLTWNLDTRGFTIVESKEAATEETLTARIVEYLETSDGEPQSQTAIEQGVEGTAKQIRALVRLLATEKGGNVLAKAVGPISTGLYYVLASNQRYNPVGLSPTGFDGPTGLQDEGREYNPVEAPPTGFDGVDGAAESVRTRTTPSDGALSRTGERLPADGVAPNGTNPVEHTTTGLAEIDDEEIERLRSLAETEDPTEPDGDFDWSTELERNNT